MDQKLRESPSQLPLFETLQGERAITDDDVADYLEDNPDFFVSRPELLRMMTPPERWGDDSVVDLQRHWVDVLKSELDGLRDCASTVIETSRANLDIQTRTHVAVLALLHADDNAQLRLAVSEDLPEALGVEAVEIAIEDAEAAAALRRDHCALAPGDVDRLIGGREVALVAALPEPDALALFGTAAIRSAALVRLDLGADGPAAALAFGAGDEGAFSPRQGSELLRFLGHVVAWRLARLWPRR